LSSTAWSQDPARLKTDKKQADVKAEEHLSLPKPLSAENIDHIVAGFSDEQMWRLLIDELKKQTQREAKSTTTMPKPEGIARFIERIKNITALLQARIAFYLSGSAAAPQQIGGIYALLGTGERGIR
jgi:hypothetical protein